MNRISGIVQVCFLLTSLGGITLPGAQTAAPTDNPVNLYGDWRGDSICVARETSCHDEKALYHVSSTPGKLASLSITFSKIVNDRVINMGTLECLYDLHQSTAKCEYPMGVWLLHFGGNEMKGTLTLKDRTLFRRVNLKRSE